MVNLFGGGDSSKKKAGSWRDGPATPSQKSWAIDLGIDFPPDITKGALSDLIDRKEAARIKRTKGLMGKLKKDVAQLKTDVSVFSRLERKPQSRRKNSHLPERLCPTTTASSSAGNTP